MLKNRFVLIGIGLGVAAAVGAGVFFFVLPSSGSANEEGEGEVVAEPTPVHVEGKLGPHIVLDNRVFTLMGPSEAPRYAKIQVVVEFETIDPTWFELAGEALEERLHEFSEEIGTGRQLLEDAITTIVSGKSFSDVSTTAGKDALREEIRAAVAALIEEPAVRRVLFTNFITQ